MLITLMMHMNILFFSKNHFPQFNMPFMMFLLMVASMLNPPLWFSFFMNSLILIDNLTLFLIALLFLTIMISSFSLKYKKTHSNLWFIISILSFSVYLSFSMKNIISFYLFFELSLIPIMLMIVLNGYNPERNSASFFLFLYTSYSALPMLFMIFLLYNIFNTLNWYSTCYTISLNMWLVMLLPFLIKMPSYPFHLWLPKAHVEAPTIGSIILASILLKLGTYGIFRLSYFIPKVSISTLSYIILFFLMMTLLSSLSSLRQIDMKTLIAYSSVIHMTMMTTSMIILSSPNKMYILMMSLSHGLASSTLFFLSGTFFSIFKTRNMLLMKSSITLSPLVFFIFFMGVSSNMSTPPSLNFMAEILSIMVIFNYSAFTTVILFLILLLSSLMSINLTILPLHGKPKYSTIPSLPASSSSLISVSSLLPLIFMWMFFPLFLYL